MKEPHYYVALTDYEQSVVLKSLFDEKNAQLEKGRYTDAIDEIILKIGKAPVKNLKVVERGEYAHDER